MMEQNIFILLFLITLGVNGSIGLPKEIHLAGIFPINGVEGWQGGQVSFFKPFRLQLFLEAAVNLLNLRECQSYYSFSIFESIELSYNRQKCPK